MIVGIAGPTASGKTTIADMLERDHGAKRLRYSMILADLAKERRLDPNDKATLQQLYLSEREQRGEDFLTNELATRVAYIDSPLIVIEGNRRLVDIETLRTIAHERKEKLKLIFIEASFEARLTRYNERLKLMGEEPITHEEFEKLERNAAENEIDNLREIFLQEGLCIDTSELTIEESMEKIKEFLGL